MTLDNTDAELLAAYEVGNNAGNGIGIGEGDEENLTDAIAVEKWTYVRMLTDCSTGWGEAVLAKDEDDDLFVICNINGPWAVQVDAAEPQ